MPDESNNFTLDVIKLMKNFDESKIKQLIFYKNLDFNIVLSFVVTKKNDKLVIQKNVSFFSQEIEYDLKSDIKKIDFDELDKSSFNDKTCSLLLDPDFIFEVTLDEEVNEIYVDEQVRTKNLATRPFKSNKELINFVNENYEKKSSDLEDIDSRLF